MTDHPITPPPELLDQWFKIPGVTPITKMAVVTITTNRLQMLATEAARWGADHELDACCEWLRESLATPSLVECFLANRRPKQPSLKEQALAELQKVDMLWDTSEFGADTISALDTIRRALEALDD